MAHIHRHDHEADETAPTSERSQPLLLAVVGAFALAAVIGMALLWPDGDRPVLAEQLGLAGELVNATITDTELVPCRGTAESDGVLCNETSFEVTRGSTDGDESSFQVAIIETSIDFETGDRIVLNYQKDIEPPFQYLFKDFQRRSPMVLLTVAFVVAVVVLGRFQGLRALAGLVVTGVMVVGFMFPAILDGGDPTAVALVAAVAIGIAALYLTHGITARTTVALLGTFAALAVTAVLAAVFASLAHFTGFNTQDAFYLQIASAKVDVPGLVLAGIIIGSLGVLDDVTVTQVSAVWQLHRANPAFGARQLYGAALEIGRDHIASAVNTLVLAYAGASLPLLLLFTQAGRRLADVAMSEVVAIEVLRTLVGSIGLVAAVPITTALAALVVTRRAGPAVQTTALAGLGQPPPVKTVPATEDDAWWEFGPPSDQPW